MYLFLYRKTPTFPRTNFVWAMGHFIEQVFTSSSSCSEVRSAAANYLLFAPQKTWRGEPRIEGRNTKQNIILV